MSKKKDEKYFIHTFKCVDIKEGAFKYEITLNKSLEHTGKLKGIEKGLDEYTEEYRKPYMCRLNQFLVSIVILGIIGFILKMILSIHLDMDWLRWYIMGSLVFIVPHVVTNVFRSK